MGIPHYRRKKFAGESLYNRNLFYLKYLQYDLIGYRLALMDP